MSESDGINEKIDEVSKKVNDFIEKSTCAEDVIPRMNALSQAQVKAMKKTQKSKAAYEKDKATEQWIDTEYKWLNEALYNKHNVDYNQLH